MKYFKFILLMVCAGFLTCLFYFLNKDYSTQNISFLEEREVWLKNGIELGFTVEKLKVYNTFNFNDTIFENLQERLSHYPQLVLFIPESVCEDCIVKELERLDNLPETIKENIIVLTKYPKLRDVKLFVNKRKISYPVYNVGGVFLQEASRQGRYALFILDEELDYHHLYFPISFIEDVTEQYYRLIQEKFEALNSTLYTAASAELEVDKKIHDFGKIAMEDQVTAVFKIKNTSSLPLVITKISSVCGCTVANWEKKPISPNGFTEINVEFTPEQKGVFSKKVFVFSNATGSPHQLMITGEVV